MFIYEPSGVCSSEINFDLRDGKLHSVSFVNGCDGNLKALGVLVEGMDADVLVKKLKGLRCGLKNTSCADQLAAAVASAVASAVAAAAAQAVNQSA
jgi:uncharacterized protein (TIGR03905 family)